MNFSSIWKFDIFLKPISFYHGLQLIQHILKYVRIGKSVTSFSLPRIFPKYFIQVLSSIIYFRRHKRRGRGRRKFWKRAKTLLFPVLYLSAIFPRWIYRRGVNFAPCDNDGSLIVVLEKKKKQVELEILENIAINKRTLFISVFDLIR